MNQPKLGQLSYPFFNKPSFVGAPYEVGSDTSKAAAESIVPELPRLEASVFECIKSAGENGRTTDEIEVITGLPHQTASARVRGLVLKSLVMDSGTRRNTRSGRKAAVWVVRPPSPQFCSDECERGYNR